jgi:Deacetylase PdaC
MMVTKPIIVTLIGGALAFTAGIITAGSWRKTTIAVQPPKTNVIQQPSATPSPEAAITPEPEKPEVVFGHGRLRIVAEEVHLKSERLRYDLKARYPQIAGSDNQYIKNLNQRIKHFAVDRYQWMLHPSKKDLLDYKKTFPEAFNEGNIDYEIVLATDAILSICFTSYDYGIGAAHTVIMSEVINWDLKAHRELKLADLFKPNSKYLEFIARYCTDELKPYEPIAPKAAMFESWNLTSEGIRFNFDPCTLGGCNEPPQESTITFGSLRPFLKKLNWSKAVK